MESKEKQEKKTMQIPTRNTTKMLSPRATLAFSALEVKQKAWALVTNLCARKRRRATAVDHVQIPMNPSLPTSALSPVCAASRPAFFHFSDDEVLLRLGPKT